MGIKIDLSATTVRVPTPYCHGESVYISFDQCISVEKASSLLKGAGIIVTEVGKSLSSCHGTNDVYVSRLRKGSDNELMLYIVADNLRRGASYNAVMIAKRLLSGL